MQNVAALSASGGKSIRANFRISISHQSSDNCNTTIKKDGQFSFVFQRAFFAGVFLFTIICLQSLAKSRSRDILSGNAPLARQTVRINALYNCVWIGFVNKTVSVNMILSFEK
jgi:hypothetical protein